MADWPAIAVPSAEFFSQRLFKRQIKSDFEAGYAQSRAGDTRARWRFVLGWRALSQADYESLTDFFDDNQGLTFTWTHPITTVVHTVRFSDNELPEAAHAGCIEDGQPCWTLSGLNLEEA